MDVADIVHDFRFSGVNRCILLCRENIEEVSDFSEKSDFDDVYAGLSTENRLELINELCSASTVKKLCIRPVTFDGRCDAETEIRVGEHIDAADAATFPEYTPNIPMLFPLSRRIREIALENAFFAFGIKAVLIFLSMIGYCNLWMAAAADLVAAVAVVMNANRVTTRSLVKTFFNK
jgi:Cd2+/Zn2+-exporting ATPase